MKITLREMFLLTLVVALTLGWSIDRSRLAAAGLADQKTAEGACELAGKLGWLLRQSGYSVELKNGIHVFPPSGGGAGGFSTDKTFPRIGRVQAIVENGYMGN